MLAIKGSILAVALAAALVAPASGQEKGASAQQTRSIDLDALIPRVSPGPGHEALQPLVGCWQVNKSMYIVTGTPEDPVTSEDMTTERHWIGDERYLQSTTTGFMGGMPYFRTGFLGYNTMEDRYEWITADNQTTILMSYYGSGEGTNIESREIIMSGSFTDPGVTSEANVGETVPMRTRIEILSDDRHVFELYFTPPGQPEMLADRMVFERIEQCDQP